MATKTLKTCSVIIFSSSPSFSNGPMPCTADATARPDAITAAGVAPRSRKRQAATMIKGKTRYSRRSDDSNSTYVTTAIPTSSPTSCAPVVKVSAGAVCRGTRLSRNGATSITPIASPVHHTAHVVQKFDTFTVPDSTSTAVPTVALSVIATRAASTMMAAASRRRSSSRRKPMRLSSSAAATGASVLPAAISTALMGVGPMGRFTANAPAKIPTAIGRPNRRTDQEMLSQWLVSVPSR